MVRSATQHASKTMRAGVYHAFGGPIAVEDVPRPLAPPGGVVVFFDFLSVHQRPRVQDEGEREVTEALKY